MKFTTSMNITYRYNVGQMPKPWIDYDLDHLSSIEKYFEKNIEVYDADNAGDETCDFVFSDGKAFRLEYSWYLNVYREIDDETGEEYPWVIGEHTVKDITLDEANVLGKKAERDWL
jgi:hypothetical protein